MRFHMQFPNTPLRICHFVSHICSQANLTPASSTRAASAPSIVHFDTLAKARLTAHAIRLPICDRLSKTNTLARKLCALFDTAR